MSVTPRLSAVNAPALVSCQVIKCHFPSTLCIHKCTISANAISCCDAMNTDHRHLCFACTTFAKVCMMSIGYIAVHCVIAVFVLMDIFELTTNGAKNPQCSAVLFYPM